MGPQRGTCWRHRRNGHPRPGARILDEEAERLRGEVRPEQFERFYVPAKELFAELCLSEDFTDFLTLPAYERVISA